MEVSDMKRKNKEEIIDLISKLINNEGSDAEDEQWMDEIIKNVTFYQEIYKYIWCGDGNLSAEEIYHKAEIEYKPILL